MNKDKLNKIAKRIFASADEPLVYVCTYAKYNAGNLIGKRVNLTDFDSYDDFIEYCKELHKDEKDPELMFLDYENFPKEYYGESGLNEELWDYLEKIKTYDKAMVDALIDNGNSLDDIDDDKIRIYDGCDDMQDVVETKIAESTYEDKNGVIHCDCFSNSLWQYHFEYERFGRELSWDLDGKQMKQYGYDKMTDSEIANNYLDSIGGLEELDFETKKQYTDLKALADDVEKGGNFVEYDGGYVEIYQ